MIAAPDGDLAGEQRDHRAAAIAARTGRRSHGRSRRQRVGRVVGPRQLGQREQGLDHPLHLRLLRPAASADGGLDLLGV